MKRRIINSIYYVVLIGFTLLFIYALVNILMWKINTNRNCDIKKDLSSKIKVIVVDDESKTSVDFDKLKKLNPDTVAYLKIPGTNIDYIVVKGKNNKYYLNHNFMKEKNIAGWIFADYENKLDGSDQNIIIYGHNTKDNSMFGSLKTVLTKEWQENKNNHDILLVTEMGEYHYQVFSTYDIKPEDYYLTKTFADRESYYGFIKKLALRSYYNYHVELEEDDKILTISSCLGSGQKRIVLHAKLVEE